MNNINLHFNLGFKFFKKYCIQYFKMLLPLAIFLLTGIIFIALTKIQPIFGVLAILISIPCLCYAFWRGYVITYALNFVAFDFYKNQNEEIKDFQFYIDKINKKELAKYLGFCAVITLAIYLPSFIYAIDTLNLNLIFVNPLSLVTSNPIALIKVCFVIILNSLFLIPFLNFYNQALFFKKPDESYINLFLNCYKFLNKEGVILAIIFNVLGAFMSSFHPVIYIILALALNLITFSVNTFWYSERC